jgi:hypothetical protein
MTRPGIGDPREPTGRCGYSTCTAEIHAYRLFCWPHWRRIPVALRERVARLQTRRYHQLTAGEVLDASRQLLAEATAAIDASYTAATSIRATEGTP